MKKLYIILISFLLFGCSAGKTTLINSNKTSVVSLVAVGDNLIHDSVYEAAAIKDSYDFKPMLSEVKQFIKKHDLAFINQETILGGKEIGLSTYPCFNSPQELGDALVDSGFNLISMANNHTLDRGEEAVNKAIDYWNKKQVIYSGALKKATTNVKLFNKNDISFAFVAYTYGTNGIPHPKGKEYLANVFSYEKAKEEIEGLDVDVIIVSMHWGNEYELYPSKVQKEQAAYLASLGVDVIIGHHPHVIQPVDMIEHDGHQTFVIYSLGNFLSDQKGVDRLIGMAVSFDIVKVDNINNTINIYLKNLKANLLYRHKFNNNFNIKMFINLNNDILNNYQQLYNEKKDLITTYYEDIDVT